MLANHVCAHLLLLLLFLPPGAKVNFAWIWCITNPTSTSLGYLTLKCWHGKIWPQLRGLPGVADWANHLEGSPHLSCKRDQIKMRDYMDMRVNTPPKLVTMTTWGPPPPCKPNLTYFINTYHTLEEKIHKNSQSRGLKWPKVSKKKKKKTWGIYRNRRH